MSRKPVKRSEYREITYRPERWTLLENLRQKATQIMEALRKVHLESIVHGSIARGDVTEKSDVDVFLPYEASSFSVETALEQAQIKINRRFVVQATPTYTMKAHIEIDERTSVSFSLMNMRKVEREFYRFGGEVILNDLRKGARICGVDKRLMLIEPTKNGHKESSIVGKEEQIAKLLQISAETILNRSHALQRRDEIGRTGVFIEKELLPEETFEMALKRIAEQNPAVRRRLKSQS
jgi:predicted nucleotidyltransferase